MTLDDHRVRYVYAPPMTTDLEAIPPLVERVKALQRAALDKQEAKGVNTPT